MSGADGPRPRRKGHRWQALTDLPARWHGLHSEELRALLAAWRKQHAALAASRELAQFNERLIRAWCIETGILERIYSLDRGVTLTLIEQGIDAALIPHGSSDLPAAQLVAILSDHREAIEGLFAFVKGKRTLSTSYIKSLHQVMTRHQDDCEAVDSLGHLVRVQLLRGEWKRLPNNPGNPETGEIYHEYSPPIHVAQEMERLISLHAGHGDVPPEIEAAWLHHRFTQVHPFQDGNGRVARALATLVFLRAGGFPLVVRETDKTEYLDALERADEGDLAPLVTMFARLQQDAIVAAIGVSQQVLSEGAGVSAILRDAAARIREALVERTQSMERAALELTALARERLETIASELRRSVGAGLPCQARVYASKEGNEYWFGGDIMATAIRLGYQPNLSQHRSWVHLRIRHTFLTSLVISFHHVGRTDTEFMVASAFVSIRDRGTEGIDTSPSVAPILLEPACDRTFTITPGRDPAEMRSSFERWLDQSIATGLEIWRRRL